jgi:hypothetical protein
MRTTSEVSLRGSGEIRVVSAVRGDVSSASAGETFIAAFRRVSGWRLRFVSPRAAGFAAAFGVGLVALLATAIAARKAIASARSYLDTSLYKPGTRDASGSVVFDDGSPPLATPSETNASHLATGRVLVRVSGATAGSYRVAPSTSAVRVLVGDAESLARDAREVARTRLSTACWCAVAFLAAIAATALYLAFGDATRDML